MNLIFLTLIRFIVIELQLKMIIFKDNDADCDNLIRTHFLSNDMLAEN